MKKIVNFCVVFTCMIILSCVFAVFGKASAASAQQAVIDTPASGQTLYNSDVIVSGWALNSSGVQRIDIYIDGSFRATTFCTVPRPDVAQAFSQKQYPNAATSGYSYTLSRNSIGAGVHTLGVAAIGNDGSVQWQLLNFTENKPSPQGSIDTPFSNQSFYNGDISVIGWALNSSGIQRIDVYLNGQYRTTVAAYQYRSDIAQAFGDYNYPGINSSGFSFSLSSGILANGSNSLSISVFGNDGTVQTKSVNFNYVRSSTASWIDTAYNGQQLTNADFNLTGWALTSSGVRQIDVNLDGRYLGTTYTNISRPDVASVFMSYNYPGASTSGFSYIIPCSQISAGNHTVSYSIIGNDGSVTSQSISFTEIKLPMMSNIDSPSSSNFALNNSDLNVIGWALSGSGINRVEIRLDGSLLSSLTSLVYRSDIVSAFGNTNYPNINMSGFNYTISRDSISIGNHTLTISVIGNDGQTQSRNYNLSMQKASARITIDNPQNNALYSNASENMIVDGWSLLSSGLSQAQLLLDGNVIAGTNTFISRPDVNAAYNANGAYENGLYSGYSFTIPSSSLPTLGTHTLTVIATGKDGSKCQSTINIQSQYSLTSTRFNISLSSVKNMTYVNNVATPVAVDKSYTDPTVLIMDPVKKWQFLNIEWRGGNGQNLINATQLNAILNNMCAGTPLVNQGQAFIDAANTYRINPVYLMAHCFLETGYGTSRLASGISGYYNMFGYGAVDTAAYEAGTSTAQKFGWNTPYKAIVGGAQQISLHYVNAVEFSTSGTHYDQKTLYEMKWDPYGWQYYGTSYQYATDKNWANSIASIINRYAYLFGTDQLTFNVPIYNQ